METAPERGVPRLFVGNLVPSIGDDALRRTLSRYGAVRSVERHPGYAHVSIVPADDAALDRCVAALHRTKWQGAELRVERAREHWATKLRREWAEDKAPRAGAAPAGAGEAAAEAAGGEGARCLYSGSGKGSVACKFKGVRTVVADGASEVSICDDEEIMARFDDDDTVMLGRTPGLEHAVVDGQVTDDSGSENEPMELPEAAASHLNTRSPAPSLDAESSDDSLSNDGGRITQREQAAQLAPVDARENLAPAPAPAPPAKNFKHKPSAAVASTFELFGLAEAPAPAEPPRASVKKDTGDPHGIRAAPPPAPSGKKRPRAGPAVGDEGYDAAAMAAERDPAVMDRARERALARGVLARLFPAEIIAAAPGEAAGAKELDRIAGMLRRPALFRGLLAAPAAAAAASRGGSRAVPLPVRGAAKKFKRYAGKSSKQLGLKGGAGARAARGAVSSKKEGDGRNPAERAGLFRKLLSITDSNPG